MSDKLKPCPFCGGIRIREYQHDLVFHKCLKCGAGGPNLMRRQDETTASYRRRVRARWNQRSCLTLEKIEEELERIKVKYNL